VLALHEGFAFSFLLLCPPLPLGRLRVCKRLKGNTARTADPNWPKAYSLLYNVMLSNKKWDRGRRKGEWWLAGWVLFRDWLGHSFAYGRW